MAVPLFRSIFHAANPHNLYMRDTGDLSTVKKTIKLDKIGITDTKIGGTAYDGTYLWVVVGDILYQLKPL